MWTLTYRLWQINFVLLKLDQIDPFLQARVKQLATPSEKSTEVEALHRAILDIITELPKLIQTPGVHEAVAALGTEQDPVVLAYRIASLLNLTLDGEQQLLEAATRADLLRGLYAALSREVQILQLRDKIAGEAREKLGKTQREYLLREQLKAIQQELGEGNGEEDDISTLRTKIQEAVLPEHVRKETDRELARLAKTPSASPEHQVIRSYLESVRVATTLGSMGCQKLGQPVPLSNLCSDE